MLTQEPENYLAKFLANPGDHTSCFLASNSKTDGGLESAMTGALETVVVDYSEGEEPKIRRFQNPDPIAAAPVQTAKPNNNKSLTMVEVNVFFQHNSTVLVDGEQAKAAQLTKALLHPRTRHLNFLVLGHTDTIGSESFNCQLATRRAQTLVSTLVGHGIRVNRLRAIGVGEKLLKNRSNGEAEENRRVGFAQIGAQADSIVPRLEVLCDTI